MTTSDAGDTVAAQLNKYSRRLREAAYVGGGLGGIVVLGSGEAGGSAFLDAPPVLRALWATTVIVAAGLLARSYGGYSYATTKVERHLMSQGVDSKVDFSSISEKCPPPRPAELAFKTSLVLCVSAALILLAAFWWDVFSSGPAPDIWGPTSRGG